MSSSEKDRLSFAIRRAEGLCPYCGRAPDDGQEVCRTCGKRLTRKEIPPGRQVLKRSFPTIAQVVRAADAAGLTYGQYVSVIEQDKQRRRNLYRGR